MTSSPDSPRPESVPTQRLQAAVRSLESAAALDSAAERISGAVAGTLSRGQAGVALRGEWLGHALHPLLTDFPLGCWLAAGILDLTGGRGSRPAARRLVGVGVVMTLPTAAAGLADWAPVTDPRARRVGLAHAAANAVIGLLYTLSWRARRGGRHGRGVLLALAGGTLAWGSGYLGGHLSLGLRVGTGERWPGDATPGA